MTECTQPALGSDLFHRTSRGPAQNPHSAPGTRDLREREREGETGRGDGEGEGGCGPGRAGRFLPLLVPVSGNRSGIVLDR
ncbi:hypothetical protein GCM10017557_43930 [Streptomyces aurantiacus]|uniref:Uncharacterized protein n=1 Tax=Streptomyces aurantiacus TaxID=47760 RepID=A0A7G1P6P1_9ACTN|nr:hypothetical protein GCM10017557_43930 [Streptomyces aurantiacus]